MTPTRPGSVWLELRPWERRLRALRRSWWAWPRQGEGASSSAWARAALSLWSDPVAASVPSEVATSVLEVRARLEALASERGDWAAVGAAIDELDAAMAALMASSSAAETASRGGTGGVGAGDAAEPEGVAAAGATEPGERDVGEGRCGDASGAGVGSNEASGAGGERRRSSGGGTVEGVVGVLAASGTPDRAAAGSAPRSAVGTGGDASEGGRDVDHGRGERSAVPGVEGLLADRGWDEDLLELLDAVRVATWLDLTLLPPILTERVTPLTGAGRQLPTTSCAVHGRMRGRWTRILPDGSMETGATLSGSEDLPVRFGRGLTPSERLRTAVPSGERPPKVTLIGEAGDDGVFRARGFASAVHGVALAHRWSEDPVVQDAVEEARFRAWSVVPSLQEGVPVGARVAATSLASAMLSAMEHGVATGPERRRLASLELHLGELALAWSRFRLGERAAPSTLALGAAVEADRAGWLALRGPDAAFAADALVRDLTAAWPMRRVLCAGRPAQSEDVAWWLVLVAAASRVAVWVSTGDALGAMLRVERWADRLASLGLRLALHDGPTASERVEAWRRGEIHVLVSAGPPPADAEPRRPALRVTLDGRAGEPATADAWAPRHDRLVVLRGEPSVAGLRAHWAGWDALRLTPPRREPGALCVADAERALAYDAAAAAVRRGATVVVAFPMTRAGRDLLSLSETMALAQRLGSTVFAEVDVEVLHSDAPTEVRRRVLDRFGAGQSRVLVTTMPLEVLGPTGRAVHVVVEYADRLDDERLLAWREITVAGGGLTLIIGEPERPWGIPRLRAMADGAPARAIRSWPPDATEPVSPLRTAVVDAHLDVDLLIEARQAAHRLLARDPGLRAPHAQRWVAVAAARWGWLSSDPCPLPAGKVAPRRRRRRRKA